MATNTATMNRLGPVFAHVERFINAGEINGAALTVAVDGAQVAEWHGGQAVGDLFPGSVPAPRSWGLGFMIRGRHDTGGYLADLLSPGSYGHGGASGCTLMIDPVADVTVAFVSTHHARTERERWSYRINSTVNRVLAALTTEGGEGR